MKTNGLNVHARLFFRPTLVAFGIGVVWYYLFFKTNIHVLEADESVYTDSVIPTLAMFHAIIAGHILVKVWEEYKVVRTCVLEDDEETFQKCRRDRIPMAIHLLLGSLSIIIQGFTMRLHFEGALDGIAANSFLAFALTLYWEVATNLDDPLKGVWYVGQIPAKWLEDK